MTWKAKLSIIRQLDGSAGLRYPDCNGNWYLDARVERAVGGLLSSDGFNAPTPAAVVSHAFAKMTDGALYRLSDGTRLRWNGTRWELGTLR